MTRTNKVQCPDKSCKKYFATQAKLDSHMKLVHRLELPIEPQESELSERPFPCDAKDCKYRSRTSQGLAMHKTKVHKAEESVKKAAKDTPSYEDLKSLTERLTKENIRLSGELETVNDHLYNAHQEVMKLREATPEKLTPGSVVVAKMDIQKLRRLQLVLQGDPEGKTEEERMGLQQCYAILKQANERLLLDLEEARKGLVPDSWLNQIQGDLNTSVAMIIEGMKANVSDRSKIVKYDAMAAMFQKEINE